MRSDIEQRAQECAVGVLSLGCLPVQDNAGRHVLVGIDDVHSRVLEPPEQTQPGQVLANVYPLPQLLSPVQKSRLTCLIGSLAQQIRLALLSGLTRYVVPRGRPHRPDERLEIDLSFLYQLRRKPSRLRVKGQCPLIQHCEQEAREALTILDILMLQFRNAFDANGARDFKKYYAYAHHNLPHVHASGLW